MLGGWESKDVTVDVASGTGLANTEAITGRIYGVRYLKDGTAPYDANATVAIRLYRAGHSSYVQIFASVAGQIDNDNLLMFGWPVLDNAGAETGAYDAVPMVNDTLRVIVSNGGTNTTGKFRVLVRS